MVALSVLTILDSPAIVPLEPRRGGSRPGCHIVVGRLFSSVAASVGPQDYLYAITGNGTGPARLVIIGE
jgi:hypothetical protein